MNDYSVHNSCLYRPPRSNYKMHACYPTMHKKSQTLATVLLPISECLRNAESENKFSYQRCNNILCKWRLGLHVGTVVDRTRHYWNYSFAARYTAWSPGDTCVGHIPRSRSHCTADSDSMLWIHWTRLQLNEWIWHGKPDTRRSDQRCPDDTAENGRLLLHMQHTDTHTHRAYKEQT